MPEPPFSLRLYRRLLKLYPAGFRENYAAELEREFRDEFNESTNRAALAMLWIRLIADLAISLPLEFTREVKQDARHTFRLWARHPWHTGFAIVALAIGIGANTGVFSVVNALLLRSLPFHEAERLAALTYFSEPQDSALQFHAWRRQSAYLADAAVFEDRDANLGTGGASRRVHTVQVSGNFFSLLGTQPIVGRAFDPADDVTANGWGSPGRNAVAVMSYGLWQELFAGDPKALGSTIRVDGYPLTVVGVAPPGFDYPNSADLWKPGAFSRGNYGWQTIARLKPGVTWEQARQAFAIEADRFWPNRTPLQKIKFRSTIDPLREQLAGPARKGSLVLMACVALILLIACTNVANLLLARAADRAAELSIRAAMGASRARISQQLLTECVLLSLAASMAGILVAYWTASIAGKLQSAPLATQAYAILDARVLCFALAISVFSALLFGLLPSLYAGRFHKFGTRGTGDNRGARLVRESLVAAQVMLTIVLLVASVSVGRAFVKLMGVDRGFQSAGLVTVNVSLEGSGYDTQPRRFAYFQEALHRVRRLPGVRSASATEFLPLYAKGFIGGRMTLEGRPASENTILVPVFTDYFRTMGGRILYGREFNESELRNNARVAIVNELFAGEFGPPAAAVGREIGNGVNSRRILGVAKGMDYMADGVNAYQTFIPSQGPAWPGLTLVARVSGRAEDHLAMVSDAIQSVDRQVPLFGVKTMEQRLADKLARPQFYRTAVLCFAAFALLLAVIGMYGIVSYAVGRRAHEMGVRMALGTTPAHLRIALLRQGLITIAAGAIPGVVGAVLCGRFLENLIEGAKSVSAATCAASVLFIALIAAAGIWSATRSVSRLDIMEILRSE